MQVRDIPARANPLQGSLGDSLATPGMAIDLRDYVTVLRRRGWIVVAAVVLALAAAGLYTMRQTPLYSSSATVLINPLTAQSMAAMERSSARPDQLINVATEQLLAQSPEVHERAAELAKAEGADPDALGGASVVPSEDVQVLSIQHVATEPEVARIGAQAYAEAYLQYRADRAIAASGERIKGLEAHAQELEKLLAAADAALAKATAGSADFQSAQSRRTLLTSQLVQVQTTLAGLTTGSLSAGEILSDAVEPGRPFTPQPRRNLAAALLVGLILGMVLAFARDRFDDRVRSDRDVLQGAGVPVVSVIPRTGRFTRGSESGLVTVTAPDSPTAESYRRIRSWLAAFPEERSPKSLLITSAKPNEGKSTVSCNLAVALAEAGNNVLLISADLRRPTAHSFFGIMNENGLTEILTSQLSLQKATRKVTQIPGLHFVPSGQHPSRPADLLASDTMRELLAHVRERYDFVIVDAPPVLSVADSLALSTFVDGTLLVVKARSTGAGLLDHARGQLTAVGAGMLGAIVWNTETPAGDTYPYYSANGGAPESSRLKRFIKA